MGVINGMERKIMYRRMLIVLLILNISAILYLSYRSIDNQIPNDIKLLVGKEEVFDFSVPIEAKITSKEVGVFSVNHCVETTKDLNINFSQPFTIKSNQIGNYSIDLSLFGILKFKEIKLDVIDSLELVPCGEPIGIYVKTDGVMVLGTSVITSVDGMNYEPALNKLKSGDYIIGVDNQEITSKKELMNAIKASKGNAMKLKIRREDEVMNLSVTPVETGVGEYKIGTWIRDDTQGIGTMTFITPDGMFGALGHGITDIDTSLLMEVRGGDVYTAEIMSIIKGKNGAPGELIGMINQEDCYRVGDIYKNTNQGIYGILADNYHNISKKHPLQIGLKQHVKLGDAVIRCNVNGKVEDYKIKIEKIDRSNSHYSKGLVIEITDKRLLSLTGGIVQGMSGSPIIQNNKIIGAVTHVFIQDSTKGYGTFIENMVRNLN